MNENNVQTLYVLDLDRTIFDTEKSVELMKGVVALEDPDLAATLERQFAEYSSQGESFSVREFIVEQVGEVKMQAIEARYVAMGREQNLLKLGAKELIAYIQAKSEADAVILTYGSEAGQAMKIQAIPELDGIPYLVTPETYKGAVIAGWRQADELYHLPLELGGVAAKSVVFVDDKPFSFKGLPIDCRGYWVKSLYDAGAEMLPSYVVATETLLDVLSAEEARS